MTRSAVAPFGQTAEQGCYGGLFGGGAPCEREDEKQCGEDAADGHGGILRARRPAATPWGGEL